MSNKFQNQYANSIYRLICKVHKRFYLNGGGRHKYFWLINLAKYHIVKVKLRVGINVLCELENLAPFVILNFIKRTFYYFSNRSRYSKKMVCFLSILFYIFKFYLILIKNIVGWMFFTPLCGDFPNYLKLLYREGFQRKGKRFSQWISHCFAFRSLAKNIKSLI